MLPEIIISSPIKGTVKINDSTLGEIGREEYQSFIGISSFYLKFIPLTFEKIYAQVNIKITVKNGQLHCDCPHVKIFNYKNGVFFLEIEPPCLAVHTLPVCLSYKTLENRFTISLMEQNSIYMVIEDENKELADGFFTLDLKETPILKTAYISGEPFIIVSDNSSKVYVFNKGENGFYQHLCLEADFFEIKSDELIISKTTLAGHVVKNTYAKNGGNLSLSKTDYTENPLPHENIAEDFLECVKFGIEKRALSLLSSDLSIDFPSLREFLGSFTSFKKSPFEENAYALIGQKDGNTFLVNRFEFEIEDERIVNIKEL